MAPKPPKKARPQYDPEADADQDGVSDEGTPDEAAEPVPTGGEAEPDAEGGVPAEDPDGDEADDDLFGDLPELEDDDDEPEVGGEDDVTKEIAEAAEGLAKLGIVVDPAHTLPEFLRHLCTALKTHHATKNDGLADPNADPMNPHNRTDGGPTMATEEPQVVSLSLEQRLAQAEERQKRSDKRLADSLSKSKLAEIDGLVASGRAKPEQARRWKEALGAKQMSLVTEDGGLTGTLAQVEAAHDNPEGTFWTAEERVQRQGEPREEPAPDWGDGAGGVDKNGEPDPHVMAKLTGGEYKPKAKKE